MKTRIISLFLSLAFLSILTFEYISNVSVVENSSSKTVENVLEKRLADKFIDDTYLLDLLTLCSQTRVKITPDFKQSFYTFKSTNILFRPPINS